MRSTVAGVVAAQVAAAAVLMAAPAEAADPFFPPATPARPVVETLHGVTLTDRYRWLEDGKDPDVLAWSRAQHAATLAYLDRAAPSIPGMRDEIARWYDRDRTERPFFKNGREFFLRAKRGEPQAKLYTRIEGRDVLLVDPMAIDPSGKTRIGAVVPNRDATRAAVGIYARGTEIQDFRIVDTTTGSQVGPVIAGLRWFAWARDEAFAFLAPRTAEGDAKQEPHRCYRHKLGADRATDELLIAMDDAKNWCRVYEPEDAPVTVFETGDFWSNTIRIRPVGSTAAPRTIYASDKFQADALFRRDRIYVRTNRDAPNWKLMAATYANPEFADWTTLIPEGATVMDEVAVTREAIVVREHADVVARIALHALDGRRLRELEPPVFGSVVDLAYDLGADTPYAALASHVAPPALYALAPPAFGWTRVWQDDVPFDTSALVSKRVYVDAKDGAKIPVFVVHRKDVALNGDNPTLLAGYGGFNIAVEPYYVGGWYPFLSRGGVYVEAGVRGGSEYGETWHEQAMFARKQNTFDDMVAVAEWLVAQKYTRPAKLAVEGGSNGGLTVGALLTQRPDLFRASICQVPLLDMVRFHKFLIARYWIAEYGDPDRAEDFRWILRYSPYQNIREGVNLPETLVVAGEYDSRVDPLHAKKFVAAVQNHPGQTSPFLLYMDFDSGHGTGKTQQQRVVDRDYELRFLMNALGMGGAPATAFAK
ncbi:MAG TPA: prolyl oligopeptidase family serine peptidase [Casimicrobiaceae bacterium]|nr:prolyl oligopeptidase family serine peptidase [Casimicrobiaceae bacterium]